MEQKAGSGRERVKEEDSAYVKFLKYHQSGFAVSDGKNRVWVPSKDKDKAYEHVEVLKDDGKTFSFRNGNGEEETLPKDENYLGVNPPELDGVEDMIELGHLNEPAVLHNLKKRYDAGLFHTYAGNFLVIVNPYKRLPIYTNEIIDLYRGRPKEKVAPHIFAISDAAYRAMIQTSTDQSILITGESGAGKTENTKRVIQYLATVAGRVGGQGTLEKQLLEFNHILEAFGNAKTPKNNSSSRFSKYIELQFNYGGIIVGANTRVHLLEKSRVVSQGPNERNFHIFYQFMSEAMKAKRKGRLHLTRPKDFHFLNQNSTYQVDGIDDAKEFEHTQHALEFLNMPKKKIQGIYETLAGILWLGNLKFEEDAGGVAILTKDSATALRNAAELLGCYPSRLKAGLLSPKMVVGKTKVVAKVLNKAKATASRDALAKTIYAELFNGIVHQINMVLSCTYHKAFSIGVLDISGFEILQHNSFEQFGINYTNEKLQQFFNHHMFSPEQYEIEKVEPSFINYGLDLQDTIDLIEKSQPMGILSILDEQTMIFPDASNDTIFTKRLHEAHESHRSFRKPRFEENTFQLRHYAGAVVYQTADWLEKNRDFLEEDLSNLMRSSDSEFLADIFGVEWLVRSCKLACKRTPGASFASMAMQYKGHLGDLMETLRSTNPHFVRCILPNTEQSPGYIAEEVVLNQLRCNGVLEGILIARKGFPCRIQYLSFFRRYILLQPGPIPCTFVVDPKRAVMDLIDYLIKNHSEDVKPDLIRFGSTKIFLRINQIAIIEQMRNSVISGMMIPIQAGVRALLARRLYEKMKEQIRSAKILQRSLRAWLELKDWAWWQLYIKARDPCWPFPNTWKFLLDIDWLEMTVRELAKKVEFITAQTAKINFVRSFAEEDVDIMTRELSAGKQMLLYLKDEVYDLEIDNEMLMKKVKNFMDEIYDEDVYANELLAETKNLEKKKAELEILLEAEVQQKKDELGERKKVEEERDEWKGKVQEEQQLVADELKKKVEDLQRNLDKALEDLGNSRGRTEELRSRLRKAETDLKNLQAEHEERNRIKVELEEETKRLSYELEDARRGIDESKALKEQTHENIYRLQVSIEEAHNEISSLKERLAYSDNNLKAAMNSEKELEEKLEDEQVLRANVERLKKALEKKVEELEEKVENLEKAKTHLSNQVHNLTANKDLLSSRKYDEKDKEKNLEDKEAEFENQWEAKRDNVSETKIKAAQEDAEKMKEDLKRLLEDAGRNDQKLRKENRRLQGELAGAKERAEKAKKAKLVAEADSRRLTAEVEEMKRKLAKESDARRRAEEGRDTAERDLEALKKEIEGLERKVAQAERDARDARSSLLSNNLQVVNEEDRRALYLEERKEEEEAAAVPAEKPSTTSTAPPG